MIGGVRHEERSELARAMPAYEIGEVLGRGAFAVVYAARHVRLQREVAIKRLAPELLRERAARERFAAEARLLASLDHPHVVRVHDYVEEEVVCALVMERLHGGSLAERAQIDRPSCARACAIMVAALYGLEHAHRRGVLHRDVKPDNVLFGEFDTVKVVDFGIAKVIGAQGTRVTATAAILGTPAFMAPEQVSSSVGPLSAATDVWGAGAVLYELLAGEPPFSREGDLGEVLFQRITESPRPLHALVSDVPPSVADAVMRSLARDPADRHPTASEFARALEDAVGRGPLTRTGIPVHRSAVGPAGGDTATLATATDAPAAVPPNATETPGATPSPRTAIAALRGRHQRWAVLMVALAALVAVGVGAVLALSAGGSESGSTSPRSAETSGSGSDARAALPGRPPGWPKTMALGFKDPVGGPAGMARRLADGGLAYQGFGLQALDRAKSYAAWFASHADRHGLLPYASFYRLRTLGRPQGQDSQAPQLQAAFRNRSLMRAYWHYVREFLQALGSAVVPAAVVVEPSVWALMEAKLAPTSALPDSVFVHVGDAGLKELRGLPDTLPGLARGWLALRNRYARKVLLGYGVDDYGTVDISRQVWPDRTLVAAARVAGQFYMDLKVFDFASLEIAYTEEGQDPDRLDVYSPAEKEGVVTFVREFVRTTKMPMVLDRVPGGNSLMKTINDHDFHWRDSWVQWLIGTDHFSGLTKLRDAGAIGIAFGVGNGIEPYATCFCDAAKDGVTNDGRRGRPATSADDDGGYFAQRAAALRRAGGLSLVR